MIEDLINFIESLRRVTIEEIKSPIDINGHIELIKEDTLDL